MNRIQHNRVFNGTYVEYIQRNDIEKIDRGKIYLEIKKEEKKKEIINEHAACTEIQTSRTCMYLTKIQHATINNYGRITTMCAIK